MALSRTNPDLENRPARYELVDKDGNIHGSWDTADRAAAAAKKMWPDQEQDPERTGHGWDVQIVGVVE